VTTVKEPEELLQCAVCGCKWEAEKAPERGCSDELCPCHFLYFQLTENESAMRAMHGDR